MATVLKVITQPMLVWRLDAHDGHGSRRYTLRTTETGTEILTRVTEDQGRLAAVMMQGPPEEIDDLAKRFMKEDDAMPNLAGVRVAEAMWMLNDTKLFFYPPEDPRRSTMVSAEVAQWFARLIDAALVAHASGAKLFAVDSYPPERAGLTFADGCMVMIPTREYPLVRREGLWFEWT